VDAGAIARTRKTLPALTPGRRTVGRDFLAYVLEQLAPLERRDEVSSRRQCLWNR
jgi:hypothetical protein